ncbi:hypothetical protein KOL64_20175 [Providencia rettgeri]|uniref:Uncharacterized protein n=1 Tax=Providencia rettgeri TaxID=587 RepID=A0AAJ6G002_PRORE|nr:MULTISPECIES: hypothetical protein [Providencia]WHT81576.1 hypothetical protein KOL65_20135 [Providencia rettgeri]WHT95663.1 hypothetical protein KOF27_20180 [Providencia rettgeri]WJM88193.1 hypothetical protein KOL64_20175 [Providencia rettgeri]
MDSSQLKLWNSKILRFYKATNEARKTEQRWVNSALKLQCGNKAEMLCWSEVKKH